MERPSVTGLDTDDIIHVASSSKLMVCIQQNRPHFGSDAASRSHRGANEAYTQPGDVRSRDVVAVYADNTRTSDSRGDDGLMKRELR